MSIKIYNGMISKVSDPFELGLNIRSVLEPVFFDKFRVLYERAKNAPEGSTWDDIDDWHNNEVIKQNILLDSDMYKIVAERHRSETVTFSDFDIGYEVCIVPNATGGYPLVMVFSANSDDYINALLSSGVTRDYGFWNNSDRDDDITEEEWKEREQAWGYLLNDKDTKSPSQVGLTINFPSKFQAYMALHNKNTES